MSWKRYSRLMIGAILTVLLLTGIFLAMSGPWMGQEETAWHEVNDFLYQLQRARVDKIGETKYDLLILDIAAAGYSPERIEDLKHSPGGEKIILCYMSIGEAEDYRRYWQREWYQAPPPWLDERNPVWLDNYTVRYWDPGWQAIVFGSPEAYLDEILELGFDGVYLDKVDTYEYYEERGRETAAREMTDFVISLGNYARQRRPGFGIFPQNAEELGLLFEDYMEVVTGIGVESLYYGYPRDNEPTPPQLTAQRESVLDRYVEAGKLVLTTDYTQRREQIDDAYTRAQGRGYVPFATVRSLGRLVINLGHEPE